MQTKEIPLAKRPQKSRKASPAKHLFSVVIPVYNSQDIVAKTVEAVIAFFEGKKWKFEIILVNDCSPDNSWNIVRKLAQEDDRLTAVNMVKNYGQHTANIVGFRYAKGDCIITMDDDLQNPPEEIAKLVEKFDEGYDLVVGTFGDKKHVFYRRAGSSMMQVINEKIFKGPDGFRHTNFRLISRSVVDRILKYKNHYPYTSGMAMMFSSNQINVPVRHDERKVGKSNYNFKILLRLAWRIMFNYSNMPIRFLVFAGFLISFFSLLVAGYLVVQTMLEGTKGNGWTSLMLVISLSNSVLFLLLSIIGEYLSVISQQVRLDKHFFVGEVVGGPDE